MYIFLSILTIIAAIVLVLVVLVQNSKGGGLSSNFSSSNQIMGAPKTADFLEKITWALMLVIIVLSLSSAKLLMSEDETLEVEETGSPAPVENTTMPSPLNETQNVPLN